MCPSFKLPVIRYSRHLLHSQSTTMFSIPFLSVSLSMYYSDGDNLLTLASELMLMLLDCLVMEAWVHAALLTA